MELKLFKASLSAYTREFKSHLYGIEINSKYFNILGLISLNRTFMELKFKAVGKVF